MGDKVQYERIFRNNSEHLGDFLVYRNFHYEKNWSCDIEECTALSTYVRRDTKWVKIGYYGSECNLFSKIDIEQDEKDRKLKQRVRDLTKMVRNAKNISPDKSNQPKN